MVKASVCKTDIPRFKSGRVLQTLKGLNVLHKQCETCWLYTIGYKAPGHMNRKTRCGLHELLTIKTVKKCPCFECLTKTLCRKHCDERLNFWYTVTTK